MKTTVPLGQVPTECPVHAPLQPPPGYMLSFRRRHVHGLWGLQAGSLAPISVPVGLGARRSALGGWPGPDFRCRLPVLPPVSQPPVAPAVCRISESRSSSPGQQSWARQGHCGREGGLQLPLSWGLPADPTHHLCQHSCCQTGTCRGLQGTTRLRGPGAPPGQEERRRCPAQPQAQLPMAAPGLPQTDREHPQSRRRERRRQPSPRPPGTPPPNGCLSPQPRLTTGLCFLSSQPRPCSASLWWSVPRPTSTV